jgi:hypothetical protein
VRTFGTAPVLPHDSATTIEVANLVALREALKHLVNAQVRFDTGRTGANWFAIDDVEVHAQGTLDPGVIIVRLKESTAPELRVADGRV